MIMKYELCKHSLNEGNEDIMNDKYYKLVVFAWLRVLSKAAYI